MSSFFVGLGSNSTGQLKCSWHKATQPLVKTGGKAVKIGLKAVSITAALPIEALALFAVAPIALFGGLIAGAAAFKGEGVSKAKYTAAKIASKGLHGTVMAFAVALFPLSLVCIAATQASGKKTYFSIEDYFSKQAKKQTERYKNRFDKAVEEIQKFSQVGDENQKNTIRNQLKEIKKQAKNAIQFRNFIDSLSEISSDAQRAALFEYASSGAFKDILNHLSDKEKFKELAKKLLEHKNKGDLYYFTEILSLLAKKYITKNRNSLSFYGKLREIESLLDSQEIKEFIKSTIDRDQSSFILKIIAIPEEKRVAIVDIIQTIILPEYFTIPEKPEQPKIDRINIDTEQTNKELFEFFQKQSRMERFYIKTDLFYKTSDDMIEFFQKLEIKEMMELKEYFIQLKSAHILGRSLKSASEFLKEQEAAPSSESSSSIANVKSYCESFYAYVEILSSYKFFERMAIVYKDSAKRRLLVENAISTHSSDPFNQKYKFPIKMVFPPADSL